MNGARRRPVLRGALWLFALLVVAAATLATLWVLVAPEHLPSIVVNGHELVLDNGGQRWLPAALAVLALLVVLTVVLPVALLFASALPLAILAIALALGTLAIGLVVGLSLAPLLLLGWLIWRATRASRTQRARPVRAGPDGVGGPPGD